MANGYQGQGTLAGRRATGTARVSAFGMRVTKDLAKIWKKEVDHEKDMCKKIFDFTKDYVKDDVKNFKKKVKDILNYMYDTIKELEGATGTGAITKRGKRLKLKDKKKNIQRYYEVWADDLLKGNRRMNVDKSALKREDYKYSDEAIAYLGLEEFLKREKKLCEKLHDRLKKGIDSGVINTPQTLNKGVQGVWGLEPIVQHAEEECVRIRDHVSAALEEQMGKIIEYGSQGTLDAFGDIAQKGKKYYEEMGGRFMGVRMALHRARERASDVQVRGAPQGYQQAVQGNLPVRSQQQGMGPAPPTGGGPPGEQSQFQQAKKKLEEEKKL